MGFFSKGFRSGGEPHHVSDFTDELDFEGVFASFELTRSMRLRRISSASTCVEGSASASCTALILLPMCSLPSPAALKAVITYGFSVYFPSEIVISLT